MLYENRTVRNETIAIDDSILVNCEFIDCEFTYDGGNINIEGCKFTPLSLTLTGAAKRTQTLLGYFTDKALLKAGRLETGNAVFERVLRKDV